MGRGHVDVGVEDALDVLDLSGVVPGDRVGNDDCGPSAASPLAAFACLAAFAALAALATGLVPPSPSTSPSPSSSLRRTTGAYLAVRSGDDDQRCMRSAPKSADEQRMATRTAPRSVRLWLPDPPARESLHAPRLFPQRRPAHGLPPPPPPPPSPRRGPSAGQSRTLGVSVDAPPPRREDVSSTASSPSRRNDTSGGTCAPPAPARAGSSSSSAPDAGWCRALASMLDPPDQCILRTRLARVERIERGLTTTSDTGDTREIKSL